MTPKARGRQPMPRTRNASGVEPPATAATPDTLSSIAIPGASTDTEIAMASQSRSEPWASSPVAAPGIRSGLVLAMFPFLSLRPAASWPPGQSSVELEVLAHLPVADVLPLSGRVLGNSRVVPDQLGALHLDQVVDQRVPEGLAEEGVLLQRADGTGQRCREHRVLRYIRICLDRRGRLKLPAHAIKPGGDVRGHVEVGVGGRLAHPVFHVAVGIAGRALDADQGAAVLYRPAHPVGGERVRPVALVAVDRRRGATR